MPLHFIAQVPRLAAFRSPAMSMTRGAKARTSRAVVRTGRDWFDITTWRSGTAAAVLLHRNPRLVRGAPGQLGAAARPNPDRQTERS